MSSAARSSNRIRRWEWRRAYFSFVGLDSHGTVVRGITTTEVILFDSWEYTTFDRRKLVWSKQVNIQIESNRSVAYGFELVSKHAEVDVN
jgi:hypothetical protein